MDEQQGFRDNQEEQLRRLRPASVLEDPGVQAIAGTYANAFLEAAAAGGHNAEEVLEEFGSLLEDVLAKFPEFHKLLVSGAIGRDKKIRLIERVIGPHSSPFFVNFLRVLARHGRLELLPIILAEAQTAWERRAGRRRVQITAAHSLSQDHLEAIRERLGQAFAFEPILEQRLDADLLGGLVVRVGDTVYDGSLRKRLNQLRSRLRKRGIHEIQSRRNRFSHSEGD